MLLSPRAQRDEREGERGSGVQPWQPCGRKGEHRAEQAADQLQPRSSEKRALEWRGGHQRRRTTSGSVVIIDAADKFRPKQASVSGIVARRRQQEVHVGAQQRQSRPSLLAVWPIRQDHG